MSLNKPTAQSVIDLTGTDLESAVVGSIIDDAALLAEKCLENLDADRQAAALRWLTAHLIASTSDEGSKSVSSSRLGDASDSYSSASTGDGISGTSYGQQAIAIAPCLARLGRARASIKVI